MIKKWSAMAAQRLINWKVFWVLLSACVFGTFCIVPYMLTMQADLLGELPIPLPLLLTLQIFQNILIFAIFTFAGLYFSRKVGLGAPLLERWSQGEKVMPALRTILGISVLLGIFAVILATAMDLSFHYMFPDEPIHMVKLPRPPAWQRILASFYGAINEEIINRLFLMSLLVWVFSKIKKTKKKLEGSIVWPAIIAAAIIFGLLHLPSTAILVPITPFLIFRAIILNGVAGTIFGWLFWKKGLESAMISHFTADIIIHGIFPLLT